jgi:PiT family inorganic phosphate transporter
MFGLEAGIFILLIFCILAACAFEFVNGFHDTANAVATVIYTNSLKPTQAVIWSGICNFIGVFIGGIGVAMGIVKLLPIEALIDPDIYHNIALILALLFSAILWNLGTWYLGLPASSSHTLIGSILGVGFAYPLVQDTDKAAVDFSKAIEIGSSLVISPVFGFSFTVLLMFIMKKFLNNDALFKEPKKGKHPPIWIRGILIATCTGVSVSHGANDGQ